MKTVYVMIGLGLISGGVQAFQYNSEDLDARYRAQNQRWDQEWAKQCASSIPSHQTSTVQLKCYRSLPDLSEASEGTLLKPWKSAPNLFTQDFSLTADDSSERDQKIQLTKHASLPDLPESGEKIGTPQSLTLPNKGQDLHPVSEKKSWFQRRVSWVWEVLVTKKNQQPQKKKLSLADVQVVHRDENKSTPLPENVQRIYDENVEKNEKRLAESGTPEQMYQRLIKDIEDLESKKNLVSNEREILEALRDRKQKIDAVREKLESAFEETEKKKIEEKIQSMCNETFTTSQTWMNQLNQNKA